MRPKHTHTWVLDVYNTTDCPCAMKTVCKHSVFIILMAFSYTYSYTAPALVGILHDFRMVLCCEMGNIRQMSDVNEGKEHLMKEHMRWE